ncbi:hypothetical protein NPIL_179251 [Nephila pilipes]|uniref:Uncharacterized protein n=1 Tax=Nephila pilipes TaxID=299642 RepID=A0A8X6ND90_NEPPI|nr:hypothetical protein NPIL_179251 [Nephila pilipes]
MKSARGNEKEDKLKKKLTAKNIYLNRVFQFTQDLTRRNISCSRKFLISSIPHRSRRSGTHFSRNPVRKDNGVHANLNSKTLSESKGEWLPRERRVQRRRWGGSAGEQKSEGGVEGVFRQRDKCQDCMNASQFLSKQVVLGMQRRKKKIESCVSWFCRTCLQVMERESQRERSA